jgi:hypothetical protein
MEATLLGKEEGHQILQVQNIIMQDSRIFEHFEWAVEDRFSSTCSENLFVRWQFKVAVTFSSFHCQCTNENQFHHSPVEAKRRSTVSDVSHGFLLRNVQEHKHSTQSHILIISRSGARSLFSGRGASSPAHSQRMNDCILSCSY